MPTFFETFIESVARNRQAEGLLDGDDVIIPPDPDFGYDSTPANALTFAQRGVDGVHYAVIIQDGIVRNDSPVVQVSPFDSEDLVVLAPSFLDYLAVGCGTTKADIERLLNQDRQGETALLTLVRETFRLCPLLEETRSARLREDCIRAVKAKVTPK